MSPIADMVAEMMDRGVDREVILLAVRTAEACSHSGGIPVEKRIEKIRAADRERKRNKPNSTGIPPVFHRNGNSALTLSSSSPHTEILPKKEKKVRARRIPLPPEWAPNEKHFAAAEKLGLPRSAVESKAEDMRIWAASSGEWKSDWDATLHGFLRRDAPKLRTNGHNHGKNSVLAAADELVERLRGFDEPAPAEPPRQLRSGTGAIAVRPVPEG